MDEGSVEVVGRTEVKLPASEVVWLEAPESATQSVTAGGVKAMVLNHDLLLVRWRRRQGREGGAIRSSIVRRCSK